MSEWHASTLVLLLATPGGILLTRSARKHNPHWSTLSVNLVAELLKLSVVTVVFLRDRQQRHKQKGIWALRTWLLCLLPAILYLLQNVLVMQALTLLPASLHAALSNLKVLFTALVSRAVLGTRFSWQTSLSLAVLTVAACSLYWTAFEGKLCYILYSVHNVQSFQLRYNALRRVLSLLPQLSCLCALQNH
jgi:drug/metabolite transporter (DMT)-like permease